MAVCLMKRLLRGLGNQYLLLQRVIPHRVAT
jgi:hypothetical protein